MLFFLLAASLGASEQHFELKLDPAEHERVNLPVCLDVPLAGPAGDDDWESILRGPDRSPRVVQAELLVNEGKEALRIYWVEPAVRAGESPEFRLTVSTPDGQRRRRRESRARPFRFEYEEGRQALFLGDRPVYQYVTEYDPDRHEETNKPYHQVYGVRGDGFITKGPGGMYPHHKGIYLGWSRTGLPDGAQYNFWGCPREYQEHREFDHSREMTGPVVARSVSTTDWKIPGGEAVVRDTREVLTWTAGEEEFVFDFTITVESLAGRVRLGGDAHHAGFQFRAAQAVVENADATDYVLPEGAERAGEGIWSDSGWAAMCFDVDGAPYTVVHMDHPARNPQPTAYSTRPYGRFGAFFATDLDEGEPLVLKYRILIRSARADDSVAREALADRYADFVEPAVVRLVNR